MQTNNKQQTSQILQKKSKTRPKPKITPLYALYNQTLQEQEEKSNFLLLIRYRMMHEIISDKISILRRQNTRGYDPILNIEASDLKHLRKISRLIKFLQRLETEAKRLEQK